MGNFWRKNWAKLGLNFEMGKLGPKNYPGYPECFILDNYPGLYPDIQDKIIQDRNSNSSSVSEILVNPE